MPEIWIEQHIGSEAVIRPEFRSSLADDLQSQWRELQTVGVHSEVRPPQHRWRAAAWLTAAAALIAGLVLVVKQPSSDAPPVDSAPSTTSTPVPSTPAPSTTSTPTTSTTEVSPPGGEADLVVPLTGGDVVEPTAIATVSSGGDPGQLSGFNGEFPPLVAAFPGSLLVLDEVPFSGLTGRALSFDRAGQWTGDLTIDGIAGNTPLWVGAAPNGILFVASSASDPSGPGVISVTAHRRVEDTFIVVDTAQLVDLSEGELHLNGGGLAIRDRQIITLATGLPHPPPTANSTVNPFGPAGALANIARNDMDAQWTVEMETDGTELSEPFDDVVGVYNDGVWYSANVSTDPTVSSRFIALLDSSGASWFRLAEWTHVASDDSQLIFTRATNSGLELAVLGPTPPDLSPDLLATWPPAPTTSYGPSSAPMMLPSITMPDGASRLEYDGETIPRYYGYVQYWVDIETGAVLQVQTRPAGDYLLEGTVVSVAPWDHAIFPRMSAGYESLQLGDPSGTVQLWTDGLSRADLLEVARSLRPRGQNPGWNIDNMPANVVAVHEGWEGGGSGRIVRWSNAELDIGIGDPGGFLSPLINGTTVRLLDIEGARAVLFDNGAWSAVSWSPAPEVTIVFAMDGTATEVEAAARSIVEVDRATWEAASRDATGEDDGCQSSFYC